MGLSIQQMYRNYQESRDLMPDNVYSKLFGGDKEVSTDEATHQAAKQQVVATVLLEAAGFLGEGSGQRSKFRTLSSPF